MSTLRRFLLLCLMPSLTKTVFGNESNLSRVPSGPDLEILSYLDPINLFTVGLTAREFDHKVVEYLTLPGIKKERDIKLNNYILLARQPGALANPLKAIDKYLACGDKRPIVKIFGLKDLVKNDPPKFMSLLLKSAPVKPESMTHLENFYQHTLQISDLVNSPPTYESPAEKLAAIYIELSIWEQIKDQVWAEIRSQVRNQVWFEVEAQINDHAWNHIWERVRELVEHRVGRLSWNRIWGQVVSPASAQIWSRLRIEIGDKIKSLVDEQLSKSLLRFKLAEAYQEGRL